MAASLFSELEDGRSFFNGKIEYDTQQFYSTLTCSLIVYHPDSVPPALPVLRIEKVIPVWWDYTTCVEGLLEPNDFSWTEFTRFFPCHA